MKRKVFALLCVLSLCVPLFSSSETTEIAYSCDHCDTQDICELVVTGEGENGDGWGQYYDVICLHCGETVFSSWRLTGPAPERPVSPPDPVEYNPPPEDSDTSDTGSQDTGNSSIVDPVQTQPQTQTKPQELKPAEPEKAVTVPSSSGNTGSSGGSGASGAAVQVVANNSAAGSSKTEPLPPVVVGGVSAEPVPSGGGEEEKKGDGTPSGEETPEAPGNTGNDTGIANPPGSRSRNCIKYPYFSLAYPSRRLNMPGDPEAWANIPGEKIYPLSGSSLLSDMLNNAH